MPENEGEKVYKAKTADNIVAKKIEELKQQKLHIGEFCALADLNRYHYDAFRMIYGNEERRTYEEWKKELVGRKLIVSSLIK